MMTRQPKSSGAEGGGGLKYAGMGDGVSGLIPKEVEVRSPLWSYAAVSSTDMAYSLGDVQYWHSVLCYSYMHALAQQGVR
eukprot:3940847-Rhodomonas_salina.5